VTVRDVDVESTFDDPEEGWFGAAEPTEPTEVDPHAEQPIEERSTAEPDTDRWFVQDMADIDLAEPVALEEPAVAAPASWETRLSNSGAWDFKTRSDTSRPWSRVVVMAAVIVAGVVAVVGVVLILRTPAVEESTPVAPRESVAPPVPSTSTAAPSAELPPPLPPPPPAAPPPSAEQIVPPVTRQYNPTYQTPDEPRKPQTNVTRTPMSATPPAPPRQTDQGRATPGESGHHGFFG
jgi:hypothetical protein